VPPNARPIYEAIRHLTRGLEALEDASESPIGRRELSFQIAVGTPLIAVHGIPRRKRAPPTAGHGILCERLGEAEPLVATLRREFVYYIRARRPSHDAATDR